MKPLRAIIAAFVLAILALFAFAACGQVQTDPLAGVPTLPAAAPAAEIPAAVQPETPLTFPGVVAIVGALVILARILVLLTPTPKDDNWYRMLIDALKKVGLHLGCILLAASLLTGCAWTQDHPTTVSVNTDGATNITGAITTELNTNVTIGVQGSGNPATGDWNAGIVVTFKEEPPPGVQILMATAGLEPVPGKSPAVLTVWKLTGKVDTAEERQAISLALANGATLTALR